MRLSDLSDLKAGRTPALARGEPPEVARALNIEAGRFDCRSPGIRDRYLHRNESVFGAFVSLDLYLVRPDSAKVDPQYLFAFLTLPATQARLQPENKEARLARLPKDELEKIKVPLPPMHDPADDRRPGVLLRGRGQDSQEAVRSQFDSQS